MIRKSRIPWMVSFADLLALILTFFILLFALTGVEKTVSHPMSTTSMLQKQQDTPHSPPLILPYGSDRVSQDTPEKEALPADYIEEILYLHLKKLVEDSAIHIVRHKQQVMLAMPLDRLYTPMRSTFAADTTNWLMEVALACGRLGNQLSVEVDVLPSKEGTKLGFAQGMALVELFRKMGYRLDIPVFMTEVAQEKGRQIRLIIAPYKAHWAETTYRNGLDNESIAK